jgi:ComF family protein
MVGECDVVVPIPLHRRRERRRRFNQSHLFALHSGRETRRKLAPTLLKRTRDTEPQQKLSASKRLQNMRDAFRSDKRAHGHRVLLVDDVVTTGATMEAASTALLDAGAKEIWCFAITRAEA